VNSQPIASLKSLLGKKEGKRECVSDSSLQRLSFITLLPTVATTSTLLALLKERKREEKEKLKKGNEK
jgi:hypothetical protein